MTGLNLLFFIFFIANGVTICLYFINRKIDKENVEKYSYYQSKCYKCKHRNVCNKQSQCELFKHFLKEYETNLKERGIDTGKDFAFDVLCKDYETDLLAEWKGE